jgi:ribosomal protein S18 acetylase RimI-like enzyme
VFLLIEPLNQSVNNELLDNLFKLTPEHVDKAGEVAGRAFQDDPVTLFSLPDEKEREQKLPYTFKMLYAYGIRNGVTYATSNNLEGIIIWLPPDKLYPSMWAMMRHGGFKLIFKMSNFKRGAMKTMKTTMAIFNYEEERHKALAPFEHWYLQNIAVEPDEQGKGYGSLLIRAMTEKIDQEDRLPIFLETNKEKNLSFYQKHGFEILEHTIIPKTDVPLWCMLRNPR